MAVMSTADKSYRTEVIKIRGRSRTKPLESTTLEPLTRSKNARSFQSRRLVTPSDQTQSSRERMDTEEMVSKDSGENDYRRVPHESSRFQLSSRRASISSRSNSNVNKSSNHNEDDKSALNQVSTARNSRRFRNRVTPSGSSTTANNLAISSTTTTTTVTSTAATTSATTQASLKSATGTNKNVTRPGLFEPLRKNKFIRKNEFLPEMVNLAAIDEQNYPEHFKVLLKNKKPEPHQSSTATSNKRLEALKSSKSPLPFTSSEASTASQAESQRPLFKFKKNLRPSLKILFPSLQTASMPSSTTELTSDLSSENDVMVDSAIVANSNVTTTTRKSLTPTKFSSKIRMMDRQSSPSGFRLRYTASNDKNSFGKMDMMTPEMINQNAINESESIPPAPVYSRLISVSRQFVDSNK